MIVCMYEMFGLRLYSMSSINREKPDVYLLISSGLSAKCPVSNRICQDKHMSSTAIFVHISCNLSSSSWKNPGFYIIRCAGKRMLNALYVRFTGGLGLTR
jgi:hypothetical protein